MNNFSKALTWLGLLFGAGFLALQAYLTITARLENGDSVVGALWFLLTFFTVLTNIGVALVHFAQVNKTTNWRWINQGATQTMFAGAIFVVMGIYHFVLSPLWQPKGLFSVADIGLHYITPIIYLAWWATHNRHQATQYQQIPAMMLAPILYLVWAMTRGQIIGEYPYPFLDVGAIGVAQTAINIVLLFIGLAGLFAILIALDQKLPRVKT